MTPLDDPSRDVQWLLGTIGFSYAEWAGNFYPRGMASGDRLRRYASRFDLVEINTTFHAVPPREVIRQWAAATPPSFRFSVKMPSAVTHGPPPADGSLLGSVPSEEGHLTRSSTKRMVADFLGSIAALDDKLAAVLIQFPPVFTVERLGELAAFLADLPNGFAYAVEFRHPSWWVKPTAQTLRQRGIAWAATDEAPQAEAVHPPSEDDPSRYDPRPIVPTADFLYVRWIGKHDQFPDRRREHIDPTPRLAWWLERLRKVVEARPNITTIYGLFDNDFAGHSPTTARRFAGLAGLPPPPDPESEDGLTLFGDVESG